MGVLAGWPDTYIGTERSNHRLDKATSGWIPAAGRERCLERDPGFLLATREALQSFAIACGEFWIIFTAAISENPSSRK